MSKRISNKEVVQILKEVLAAMEVKRHNRFRIRAYQNAIAAIDNLTVGVYDLWEGDRLEEIPGVGAGLKQHLEDLFTKGEVSDFERVKKDLPEGMFPLLVLRGIGAKRAFKLAKHFNLNKRENAIKRLKKAAEEGEIRNLEGFGEKSESQILEAVVEAKKSKKERQRLLRVKAEQVADRLRDYMKQCDAVKEIYPLGSLRRRMATVGDIDVAVSTEEFGVVMKHFLDFSEIKDLVTQGDKMATVVLKNGLQIDILLSKPKAFGSMLQHFTGSKNHNVLLRTYALEKGFSLSQYGIKKKGKRIKYATEEGFYSALDLDYIPPELREGTEEIELAKSHKLPTLIKQSDIKGDLHMHTVASDGLNTVNEMVKAAIDLGYEYIGISDHSPSIQTRGKKEVLRLINGKRKSIDELNEAQDKIKILFGYEVNILADATLSLPVELLKKLDFVIAAIHTAFTQSRGKVTERLVASIKNPYVHIIGHPTGRLINERKACDINWDKVLDAVKKYDKILEINSQPNRLDLPEDLVKEAKKRRIKLIINTDAHSVDTLSLMRYGIDVARRGWCEKGDVLNTLPLEDFMRSLRK